MAAKKETAVEETVAQEPTAEDVVKEMVVASLADIKGLPDERLKQAVPFTIPGTKLTVMVAPCDALTQYDAVITQMKMLGTEDEAEKRKQLEILGNSMLKACVVDPKLDDGAIDALNQYVGGAVTALLGKCRELSNIDNALNTVGSEAFF